MERYVLAHSLPHGLPWASLPNRLWSRTHRSYSDGMVNRLWSRTHSVLLGWNGRLRLPYSLAPSHAPQGDVAVAYRPMSKVDRAITAGNEALGFIKLVYAKDGTILGATVMGPSAGELISEISVAMAGKVKLPALASIMHAYPTVSIALQQMAAEVYYDQVRRAGPVPTRA